jgi:hypothetical protein
LEESTRLRRDLGFRAGVAANLIGLSYIATAEDRTEDAIRFADEASALAQAARAAAIVVQAEAARTAAQACAG